MGSLLRARWAWLNDEVQSWVELHIDDDGSIISHRPLPSGASVDHSLLLPGLINAHTHVELSDQRGKVPPCGPDEPMHEWVGRSYALRTGSSPAAIESAAREMAESGVRGCIDIHNGPDLSTTLAAHGLEGSSLHEVLGWDSEQWAESLSDPPHPVSHPSFAQRVTAHAPISCSPELLQRALQPDRVPCTIHCEEAFEDREFLSRGSGPWADFLNRLGRPWKDQWVPSDSGVALLDQLSVLHRDVGLVHLVFASKEDLDRVAASGARVILCPRSNLHISGRLPDVPAMLERQIPLAIGTDSLASAPDLDPLAEAALLAASFPEVRPEVWVRALTTGGAALLPGTHLGQLSPGFQPGVLSVDLPEDEDPIRRLLDGSSWKRYWAA